MIPTRLLLGSLLIAAGVTAAAPSARAQDRKLHAADSLIAHGLDRARAGDTASALRDFSRATHVAPRYALAHYHRGVLLERSTSLGFSDMLRRREATQEINQALELDAGNPLYLMELGRLRLKVPFLRFDAERLFNKALEAAVARNDPKVLAEVRWELGQIHDRRYLSVANRRLITNPSIVFDVTEAVANWHYTADFFSTWSRPLPDAGELDYRQAELLYRGALQADSSHTGAAIGLLGLLCDGGRYEEMVSVAEALRHAQPAEPRIMLALGLALHHLNRESRAAAVFDTAIALLPADERHDMLALENVLRRDAARNYEHLTDTGRVEFERLYWQVADPLLLTPANEAHIEYLARVAYADLRFSSPEFHLRGWQTDRGDILMRYGEPPRVGTLAPETQEIANSESMARILTVWYYPKTKLRFVFSGPPAFDVANFAGDFRDYADNARFLAPVTFDNLDTRVPVDSVGVQVARFRTDTAGRTELSIFADLPTAQLLAGSDVRAATLETGLFITDPELHPVAQARDSALVRLDHPDAVSSRAWYRTLSPGEYLYRVEARQQVSGHSARGMSRIDIVDYAAGSYGLSDLLIARHIAPRVQGVTPRARSDFLISPSGNLTFAPTDTVYMYWETYGLAHDSTGLAKVHIDLLLRVDSLHRRPGFFVRVIGGVADAVGVTAKGNERVTLSYDKQIPLDGSDRAVDYLALSLGDAPPGTYTMELAVKDLLTNRTVTQKRVLQVRQQ